MTDPIDTSPAALLREIAHAAYHLLDNSEELEDTSIVQKVDVDALGRALDAFSPDCEDIHDALHAFDRHLAAEKEAHAKAIADLTREQRESARATLEAFEEENKRNRERAERAEAECERRAVHLVNQATALITELQGHIATQGDLLNRAEVEVAVWKGKLPESESSLVQGLIGDAGAATAAEVVAIINQRDEARAAAAAAVDQLRVPITDNAARTMCAILRTERSLTPEFRNSVVDAIEAGVKLSNLFKAMWQDSENERKQVEADAAEMEEALRDLVNQIAKCNPIDDHEHDFKMNRAYCEAVKLLDTSTAGRDLLARMERIREALRIVFNRKMANFTLQEWQQIEAALADKEPTP